MLKTNISSLPKNAQNAAGVVILIIILAVIYAVYKGFIKFGEFTGIIDTAEEIQTRESTEAAVTKMQQEATKAGIKPTRTEAAWLLEANALYEALKYSAASDDKTKAYFILARVLNDADMALLIKGFGLRQEYAFGIPTGNPKDLKTFVNSNISQDNINALNDLYRRSKMTFRF